MKWPFARAFPTILDKYPAQVGQNKVEALHWTCWGHREWGWDGPVPAAGAAARRARDGTAVAIGAAKLRVLLATLLVAANRVVSVDELCGRIWEDGAPGEARSTLQSYVMRLRRLLDADELIETHPGGYLIRVADDEPDLVAFGRLIERGLPREALALWRGEPLADVPSEGCARRSCPR